MLVPSSYAYFVEGERAECWEVRQEVGFVMESHPIGFSLLDPKLVWSEGGSVDWTDVWNET